MWCWCGVVLAVYNFGCRRGSAHQLYFLPCLYLAQLCTCVARLYAVGLQAVLLVLSASGMEAHLPGSLRGRGRGRGRPTALELLRRQAVAAFGENTIVEQQDDSFVVAM